MHTKMRSESGVTLLELMIAMAITAVLMTVGVPGYRAYVNRSLTTVAIADISGIYLKIQSFVLNDGGPPPDLGAIGFAGKLDPWGNPYVYLSFEGLEGKGMMRKDKNLVPVNSEYDLYSLGPDGKSVPPFTAKASHDDIVLANDGGYIGPAEDY